MITGIPKPCGQGSFCKEPRGKTSEFQSSKVGFPIRKFTDQSLFAAPRDLSQRTTSFIASQRQGIHRMPLRHLIVLIFNAHPIGTNEPSVRKARGRDGFERPVSRHQSYSKDQLASHFIQRRCGQAPTDKSTRPLRTRCFIPPLAWPAE